MFLRIIYIIFFGITLSWAQYSSACTIGPQPTFKDHFESAQHIFIFQLESLSLVQQKGKLLGSPIEVSGRIRVTESLKGKAPQYKYITFSTHWCGGLRLDVGHYFIAFVKNDGVVLKLDSGDRSVLDLRSGYFEPSEKVAYKHELLEIIKASLNGKPLPRDFPSIDTLQFTQYNTPPPLPGHTR
jgi:hypothetical protein